MKNSKGITLVALVITIVVLLILAGVTISMVLGPNGVLSNANKAKTDSAKSTAQDALDTALSSITTDIYAGTNTDLQSFSTPAELLANASAFKTALEKASPSYTYTVDSTNKKITVQNKSKASEQYTATITDQLTISDFQ